MLSVFSKHFVVGVALPRVDVTTDVPSHLGGLEKSPLPENFDSLDSWRYILYICMDTLLWILYSGHFIFCQQNIYYVLYNAKKKLPSQIVKLQSDATADGLF